ncbi:hypothetical protein GOP47_0013955 [Adiantum capillus-veneris]|uniref:Alpha-1,4 glucan phosphorylase n=1 Tax=Adiantum capillus-veneris TaxID=13818 RepID=A0A9D4UPH8_ADICA|nr:hypothetical protein GOP47_0013955 [Adiantum capillus-veneris]
MGIHLDSMNGDDDGRVSKSSLVPAIAHPTPEDSFGVAVNIKYHVQFSPHFSPLKFELEQAFYATAESVRDTLIESCENVEQLCLYTKRWNETYLHFHKANPKQTYYLSMEYLQGRALLNAVGNLGLTDAYAAALNKLGYELEDIVERKFSPWEIVRHDIVYSVQFFGEVQGQSNGSRKWVNGEVLQALAYDIPIPGYGTKNTISLRIWDARAAAKDFDLYAFNDGHHERAAHLHSKASQICSILYPGDATEEGKLLRLKQQYFLCSASLQDIIARFKERQKDCNSIDWRDFPNKVAVQMNDTHPTLAIPKLMRLLMDVEGLGWDEAWSITSSSVAYTNHSVLPEALEKWPQSVLAKLLPRHMEIIAEIDKQFQALLHSKRPDLESRISDLQIIDGSNPEKVVIPMAHLCVISSHTVNGVAELHSNILKNELFSDFNSLWPNKFQNKTNGITPRRWLRFCSPELSTVITKWLRTDKWVTNLDLLQGLCKFADDKQLHKEWAAAKHANKARLANYVLEVTGIQIQEDQGNES